MKADIQVYGCNQEEQKLQLATKFANPTKITLLETISIKEIDKFRWRCVKATHAYLRKRPCTTKVDQYNINCIRKELSIMLSKKARWRSHWGKIEYPPLFELGQLGLGGLYTFVFADDHKFQSDDLKDIIAWFEIMIENHHCDQQTLRNLHSLFELAYDSLGYVEWKVRKDCNQKHLQ